MTKELVISTSHLDALYNHARRTMPYEAAALLFGRFEKDRAIVTRVEALENILRSTTAFAIDPEEEYQLIEDAEKRQEEIVGIFHSHPAPPVPSARDLENMRLNPVVWLITSMSDERQRIEAFVYCEGQAVRLKMTVMREDTSTET